MEAATIFAPSDGAFAKLPAEILEGLTMEQKRAIVSRHVVAGICLTSTYLMRLNL